MKRKIAGLVLFCLILFAAILAGYWDMLSAEKLKVVRDKASNAVGEIADIVRDDPDPAPAETAAADAQSTPAGEIVGAKTVQPAAAPPATAADATATADAAPPATTETAAASPNAATPAADAPAPPTFDILRVEPDGSTVLAGRAPAGAAVSLLDGTTTIGSETANATGEFVVVLNERLAVGDHQIKIEAKLPDGRSVASAETAIVSIPEAGREADLLAMVEAPDQASRLISIPAAKPGDTPTGAEGEAAGEDIAALPKAEPPAGDLLLPGTPQPGSGVDESLRSGAAPSDTAPAVAPPGSAATAPFSSPPASGAKASATLLVEAVEIENDTVYVAGRSTGGASVRVYIDNAFLAEDRRPAAGRFLVSAKAPVATGDHTVRADSLDASGAVLARVEVPFFKPEGEAMSAISPDEAAPDAARPGGSPADPSGGNGTGTADIAALATIPAPSSPHSTAAAVAPAETPAPVDPAGAADAVPPAGDRVPSNAPAGASLTEAPSEDALPPESPADALADRMAAAEPVTTPPASDPATTAPSLSDAPSPTDSGGLAGSAAPPVEAQPSSPSSQSAPVDADRFGPAGTASSEPALPETGAGIAVTRQPALQGAPSRVIIRRGDTLWRISRETYGLGRRYTVIYLANGDQIRNPDRIYPGQVFRVPKDDAADAGASRVQ